MYGYARANLRPAVYPKAVAFRLQGPSTRLYINGQLLFDFQSESQLMVVTPCVQLQNSVDHEIYLYFATRVRQVLQRPHRKARSRRFRPAGSATYLTSAWPPSVPGPSCCCCCPAQGHAPITSAYTAYSSRY